MKTRAADEYDADWWTVVVGITTLGAGGRISVPERVMPRPGERTVGGLGQHTRPTLGERVWRPKSETSTLGGGEGEHDNCGGGGSDAGKIDRGGGKKEVRRALRAWE